MINTIKCFAQVHEQCTCYKLFVLFTNHVITHVNNC